MLNEFLGLPSVENLTESLEAQNDKSQEIHKAIVKLTSYPEWPIFEAELDRLYKEVEKTSCEVYAQNPNQAHYDSGMKRSLLVIKNFIKNCILYCQKYEEDKKSQG
jgi:hypothetical protein